MKSTHLFVFILFIVSCNSSSDSPTDSKLGSAFIGHTFAFQYYPVDSKDREQSFLAKHMNSYNFSAQFVDDSTFVLRSNSEIGKQKWELKGDSINLGGTTYLLTNTGQSFLLIRSEEKLELMPLN